MLTIGATAYWEAASRPCWVVELDAALPGQRLFCSEATNQYRGITKDQAIRACIEDLKRRGLTGKLRIN